MPGGRRVEQFGALTRRALADLFDQRAPFGRLALVQVCMLAGDTLVTISLADSLFFSISPHEAKGKVLLYLLLTLTPFAVVAPLLGPLIDRSKGARRATAVSSALGRAALCPLMAGDVHSLLLFPEAFLVLVLSKLYLVTRGALVPEMMAVTRARARARSLATGTAAEAGTAATPSYAALNARLTLLGTLAGFAAAVPGVVILKLAHAPVVLLFAMFVFALAAVAAARLPVLRPRRAGRPGGALVRRPRRDPVDADLASLQPIAEPQVLLGLTANSLLRGIAGFFVFMLAFGLRRLDASLFWYGFALGASGVGSLVGLVVMPRLRRRAVEPELLFAALWLVAAAGMVTAMLGNLPAQGLLALAIGIAGSIGQPSFDAIAQRYVPEDQQGRAFAHFATRQQLVWVLGALVPVVFPLPLPAGAAIAAAAGYVGGMAYAAGRMALSSRALPRQFRPSRP